MNNTAQHRLALPSGFKVGRYELQEVIGSGGFGITYLAKDTSLGRRVAVKELLPNNIATRIDGSTVVAKTESDEKDLTWARERFLNEGRALAACDHPNVVDVFEMVEANGTAYMVTKYEEGQSFEQWLRNLGRPPTESELRSILMPLLSGLESVHNAGFLHRDLKPDNIYITKTGRPLLLDFGSARQAISSRTTALTSIVTNGYAPFEQYDEEGHQGAWSDIYALAAVMYRAISGKKPPDATRRLKDDPCEKLAAIYSDRYSTEFLRAIDRGLEPDEKKRPQTIAEWRESFESSEDATVLLEEDDDATRLIAPPRPVIPQWRRFIQEHGALVIGAGGALLLLIVVVLLLRPNPQVAIARDVTKPGTTPAATAEPSATVITATTPTPRPVATATPPPQMADITPAPSLAPASAVPAQLDPRLVGSWQTTAMFRLPNSNPPVTVRRHAHWQIAPDGHYTLTGPFNDSGFITSANNTLKDYSNSAPKDAPEEYRYTFYGEKLVVESATNRIEWQRVANVKSLPPSGEHQSSHRRQQGVRPEDVGHAIIHRVFKGRFP